MFRSNVSGAESEWMDQPLIQTSRSRDSHTYHSSDPEYSSESGEENAGSVKSSSNNTILPSSFSSSSAGATATSVELSSTVRDELERLRLYRKCFEDKLCSLKQSINELLTGIESLRMMNEQLYRNGVLRLKSFKKKKRSPSSSSAMVKSAESTVATGVGNGSPKFGSLVGKVGKTATVSGSTLSAASVTAAAATATHTTTTASTITTTTAVSTVAVNRKDSVEPLLPAINRAPYRTDNDANHDGGDAKSPTADQYGSKDAQHRLPVSILPVRCDGFRPTNRSDVQQTVSPWKKNILTTNNTKRRPNTMLPTMDIDSLKDHAQIDALTDKEIDSMIDSLNEGARLFFDLSDQQILEYFEQLHLDPFFLFAQPLTECYLDEQNEENDEEEEDQEDEEEDADEEVSQDNDYEDFEMIEDETLIAEPDIETTITLDSTDDSISKPEEEVDEIFSTPGRIRASKDVMEDSGAASDSSKDSFYLEASDEEFSIVCRQDTGDKSRKTVSPDSTLCSSPDDYLGKPSNSRPSSCSLPSIAETPPPPPSSQPPTILTSTGLSSSTPISRTKTQVVEPVADFQLVRLRPVRRSATFNEPSRSAPHHLESIGSGCSPISDSSISASTTTTPDTSVSSPSGEPAELEKLSFHNCRNLWERRSLSKEYKYKPLESAKKPTTDEMII